jgi:hypothetical protein
MQIAAYDPKTQDLDARSGTMSIMGARELILGAGRRWPPAALHQVPGLYPSLLALTDSKCGLSRSSACFSELSCATLAVCPYLAQSSPQESLFAGDWFQI